MQQPFPLICFSMKTLNCFKMIIINARNCEGKQGPALSYLQQIFSRIWVFFSCLWQESLSCCGAESPSPKHAVDLHSYLSCTSLKTHIRKRCLYTYCVALATKSSPFLSHQKSVEAQHNICIATICYTNKFFVSEPVFLSCLHQCPIILILRFQTRFFQVFFINQCLPGLWVSHWDRFKFFQKFAEIIANEYLSAVSTTPAKKDKNFEIKFCKIFCKELILVHFTPKDWIFAYFSFLGVGKLILAGLSVPRCHWHRRKIYRRCRWHRWTVLGLLVISDWYQRPRGKMLLPVSLTPVINCSPVSTTPPINCSPMSTTPPINFSTSDKLGTEVYAFCKTISGRRSRPRPPILSLEQPWKGADAPHMSWSEAPPWTKTTAKLLPPKLLQTKKA